VALPLRGDRLCELAFFSDMSDSFRICTSDWRFSDAKMQPSQHARKIVGDPVTFGRLLNRMCQRSLAVAAFAASN